MFCIAVQGSRVGFSMLTFVPSSLDAFVHMYVSPKILLLSEMSRPVDDDGSDAEDTKFVYDWRLQQEAALRASKGAGMTDEQVINFVNGCKCHQARRSQAIAEYSPRVAHNPSRYLTWSRSPLAELQTCSQLG